MPKHLPISFSLARKCSFLFCKSRKKNTNKKHKYKNRKKKPVARNLTLTQRPSWRRVRCTWRESDSLSPVQQLLIQTRGQLAGREFSLLDGGLTFLSVHPWTEASHFLSIHPWDQLVFGSAFTNLLACVRQHCSKQHTRD